MVGSIYRFFRDHHGIGETLLNLNYRSNETIVGFSRYAGYGPALQAHSPDLRLRLLSPLPAAPPPNWPVNIHWTPEWSAILDPGHATSCFVYSEGLSSQWNRFEAQTIAAIAMILHSRMADRPENECDVFGAAIAPSNSLYNVVGFWERGIGIVTPHRAQQGLIIGILQRLFVPLGHNPALIRSAVDTVERFQGQQRDVILATFALGDPDAIADEDEFLLSLNRFNVMASRARAKLVTFVSQEVVNHLSGDLDVLRESRLLKLFVESYCRNRRIMDLGWIDSGQFRAIQGTYRYQ